MREFEKGVQGLKDWKNLCLAKAVVGGEVDEVACQEPKSFKTPLNLFGNNLDKLEAMTEE